MGKKERVFLYALLFLLLGIIFYQSFKGNIITNEKFTTQKICSYQYLNPLRCEPDLVKKKKEYTSLKNELNDYIEQEKKDEQLITASVYFRDLENGPIMNINGLEDFAPASLLKLPLVISYYQKAEKDPALLQKKISVPNDINTIPQNIKPEETAEKGKTYTIDNLIKTLITQSDNASGLLLLNYLNKNYPDEDLVFTLGDLGIIDPRKSTDEQYVNAQTYASVYRVLYNSSYLNLDMSNKALMLLAQSEFHDGLVAGVPSGTKVAHKFGERKNGAEQQLHDCGIVYYTEDPYILCIMTKGYNTSELIPIIQHMSKRVYEEVSSRN